MFKINIVHGHKSSHINEIRTMTDSLLVKLYLGLPDADRRDVLKAMQADAFNRRPEVLRLLEYIEQFNSEKKRTPRSNRTFSKEDAYIYIHCDGKGKPRQQTYDDARMRHLMTYAAEAIRNYLAWNNCQEDALGLALHRCKAMKKHGLDDLFEMELSKTRAKIEASPFRSIDYYYHRQALELESWEFLRAKQRNNESNLQVVGDAFGAFVAVNTLRQGCAALAQQTHGDDELPIPYLAETLAMVESGAFAAYPAVETYYHAYKALTVQENDAGFAALKTDIAEHGSLFPDAELRDLYILAINFCIRRLNAGQRGYIKEAFDLYRDGLQRGVFLENGYLSRFTYRNILNLALALKEWDWALEYLHTFAQYLPPRERDNVYRYNLATYYFRRPEPEKALELLRHVEFRDILYNFDARRMLLRMFYEQESWHALDSLLDSFAAYLKRHPKTGYHREMYHNLVRFTKKLLSLRPGDAKGREALRLDIEKTTHLAEREWLLGLLYSKP